MQYLRLTTKKKQKQKKTVVYLELNVIGWPAFLLAKSDAVSPGGGCLNLKRQHLGRGTETLAAHLNY